MIEPRKEEDRELNRVRSFNKCDTTFDKDCTPLISRERRILVIILYLCTGLVTTKGMVGQCWSTHCRKYQFELFNFQKFKYIYDCHSPRENLEIIVRKRFAMLIETG